MLFLWSSRLLENETDIVDIVTKSLFLLQRSQVSNRARLYITDNISTAGGMDGISITLKR